MFRYELKDKERQAAFEKALPGFDKALQTACEYQYGDGSCCVTMQPEAYKGILISNLIVIDKDAIAAKEVYDPKKWNSYPAVKPPIGVPMRIEYKTSKGHIGGILALFFDGMWRRCTPEGTACFLTLDRDVKRFRPWDDEGTK